MICNQCGRQDSEGHLFCTFCGAPMMNTGANLSVPQFTTPPVSDTPVISTSLPPTAPPSDPLIGRTIEGKYRIEARLGTGGMGTVYRVLRLMIGDTVALKVMHPEQAVAPDAAERFRREAQAAARLKHPNAVTIYDFGVSTEGLLYLVMELAEGESLRDILARQGPFTPSAAAGILSQVAAALDEAHRQNIVHRDLKPDNIVVHATPTGLRVKVLDFGIAKLRDLQTMDNLTQTGALLGTPHYMSPEQCLGEELDGRSDIYSLGIVLYEMLTRVVPFNSPNSSAIIVQHVQQLPSSPRALNISIPPAVEEVVLHALQKPREARPQTAGQLAQEMSAALHLAPTHPTNASMPRPTAQASLGNASPPLAPTMQMDRVATPMPVGSKAPSVSNASLPPYAAPAPATKRSSLIAGTAIGGVLLMVAVIVGYVLFFSAKASILAEIKKGNFVKPEGSSAYDLFLKSKSSLSSSDVSEISNEVIPKLESKGNEIIDNLRKETTDESEASWAEGVRVFGWLNELHADKKYEARKYFSQARLDFMKKDHQQAISGFRRATELDPTWAMAFNGLARAYLGAKDRFNARDNYRRATNLDPAWIYPWINLGQLCIDMDDYGAAETALRQAANLDPQKASVHYLLGLVYEKTGNICAARAEYQTAIDSAGNSMNPGFSVDKLSSKLQMMGC